MRKFSYILLLGVFMSFFTACAIRQNYQTVYQDETLQEVVIADEIGFSPALDAEEKDLKMWQQIGERLEETLSDLEGVDDADIEIDRRGDALKVDVGIAYSDSAQDAETLRKNIEKTVAQVFPDGAILSFYEKAESSETESDETQSGETQSNRVKPWYGAYQSILNDWTVIGQYGSGEIGYIKQYFGKDYQFDSYWLSDIDDDGTPELFLHAEHMNDLTAVFTYSDNELIYLMVDAIYGINKEKAEVVINGHWHGAGGSGINEWHVYRIENDEAVYVWMFDKYHETRYEIWDVENWTFYEVQETGDQYIELYDAHVEGCVLASSYQKYDLDDLSGLDFIQ